jgi:two-component system sensor histidine kinase HydH
MQFTSIKRLYLPALSIIGTVVLMLVIISISTYRNIKRQQETSLLFLNIQGKGLLNSLEAGIRSDMMMPMWEVDDVDLIIREIARNEEIAYIYIFNEQDKIVYHTNFELEGERAPWTPQIDDDSQTITRIVRSTDGKPVYEIAKKFSPFNKDTGMLYQSYMMRKHYSEFTHLHKGDDIVIGLDMMPFESARRSDLHHALIMAIVIFALGSGALFFIFVIQNYYLVDKALKQTKDYTRQVVASMANGLISINAQGLIVSYNDLALELLGLEESDIRGMDLQSVFDFESTGIHDTLTKCQSVMDREINHRIGSENHVPLAVSVTPIFEAEGKCAGAVIILRDLSEIKKLEEKVRRSEKLVAIGKLAAGVAHEIRNPLSSIRGFAQFLRHALIDRPQDCEYAQTIVTEVDRINTVVEDLITFARPMVAELAPTDLNELVAHTVRLVQEDARSKGISIKVDIAPDVNKIPLDRNQITQALLNLLLNALHSVGNRGRINIGARKIILDNEELQLTVEDDGPGISQEALNNIFDPFFTTREKGTGLGLPIVHKIVENHDGDIRVESPVAGKSRGCRFTIHISVNIQSK